MLQRPHPQTPSPTRGEGALNPSSQAQPLGEDSQPGNQKPENHKPQSNQTGKKVQLRNQKKFRLDKRINCA
jgi:hypothetical protein